MPPDVQPDQSADVEPTKKNKPKATRLRQQKLPAWQPILTASTVIPTVFCVGVIFIPIGIALFIASNGVQEKLVKYAEHCEGTKDCQLTITLDADFPKGKDIYFYYYLENFYQNHRRYVKSRNDRQYLGELKETSDCEPFAKDEKGVPIVPCGAVANSMFNDTFILTEKSTGKQVPLTSNDILWDVDRDRKFDNPKIADGKTLCDAFADTAKPPNWDVPICQKEDGLKNVDFIIWMRTSALPNFRKLWRKLDTSEGKGFTDGLKKGDYILRIKNNYPVRAFNGEKGFIISTTSWAGGKNSFLGIAYLVVGGLAVVLGVIFVAIHIRFGHSITDLSNNPNIQ